MIDKTAANNDLSYLQKFFLVLLSFFLVIFKDSSLIDSNYSHYIYISLIIIFFGCIFFYSIIKRRLLRHFIRKYNSIFNILLKLPSKTKEYPAHDYNGNYFSTIENEKKNNPRLQVKSADQYAEIMNNLNLPDPKLMDVAIPRNLKLGGK